MCMNPLEMTKTQELPGASGSLDPQSDCLFSAPLTTNPGSAYVYSQLFVVFLMYKFKIP
jgi:hypothetical protein